MKQRIPAFVMILGLFLASCDNDYGLLKSIQEEEKQNSESLFYRTSVSDLSKFGGRYYAAMSALWSRADSQSSWSKAAVGGLGTYTYAGMGVAGSELFVLLYGEGLYKTSDGSTWTLVAAHDATKNFDRLFAANGVIFLQAHDEKYTSANSSDDVFALYHMNGATPNPTSLASTGTAISGLVYADGAYWAAIGGTLKTLDGAADLTSGAWTTASVDSGLASGTDITTLHAGSLSGDLYLGTDTGLLYRRASAGDSWTSKTVLDDARVTAILEITGQSRLIVGVGGSDEGYYELSLASGLGTPVEGGTSGSVLASATNYDTSLSSTPITAFYWDQGSASLFAAAAASGLASSSGLYRNTLSGGSWSGWKSE